jgi:hypothetical protein
MDFRLPDRNLERIWRLPYGLARAYRWRKRRPPPKWRFKLNANTFDPANSIINVTFYTNGVALGGFTAPSYRLVWSNVPVGIYSVSARATTSGGLTTNSARAVVLADKGGAPALTEPCRPDTHRGRASTR